MEKEEKLGPYGKSNASPCVSVVVPVYNKGHYVGKCIESVLSQSFHEFELIIIDDASTDNSYEVVKSYQKTDSRISIIKNRENIGAGRTRNKGIKAAKGKYLLFVDADDQCVNSLLEQTVSECEEYNLDIVKYNMVYSNEATNSSYSTYTPMPFLPLIGNGVVSGDDLMSVSGILFGSPYTQLFKRSFIVKNGIEFQSNSNVNDQYFVKLALILATRIRFIEKPLYIYNYYSENQISKNHARLAENYLKLFDGLTIKLLKEKKEGHLKSINSWAIRTLVRAIDNMNFEEQNKQIDGLMQQLRMIAEKQGGSFTFLNEEYQSGLVNDLFTNGGMTQLFRFFNEYDYMLKLEIHKREELMTYARLHGMRLAIWGYGNHGKAFADACRRAKIKIDVIVDRQYTAFKNDDIKDITVLGEDQWLVMVPNENIIKPIFDEIFEKGYRCCVIDIQSYFTYGFRLEECVFCVGDKTSNDYIKSY